MEFLTTKEVAGELGVSVLTVHRIREREEIGFHKVGGQYRYSREDLNNYLATIKQGRKKSE